MIPNTKKHLALWRPILRHMAGLLLFLSAASVYAQMDYSEGDLSINWDTTLSYGTSYRLDDPDLSTIGLANGGEAFSVNGDDGNLNYDGIFSNALKFTSEIELRYKNFGAFFRGRGFYDYENEDGDRERTPLTEQAKTRVGSRLDLLDAYVWFEFNLGSVPVEVRLGEQVLSWGESTFIQNSINAINPVDVSAIRVPGAELREALLPEGLAFLSMGLSENIAVELFYQYQWNDTEIDPPGSYFSTNDFAGDGGQHVFLGFGDLSDVTNVFFAPNDGNPFNSVPRLPDQEPEDGGQYGAAIRWFAPALGDTEFGFYFINYHSRLPTINGRTGTIQGALNGISLAPAAAAAVYAAFGVGPGVSPEVDAAARAASTAAATHGYAQTAGYFLAFPEDIKLYGVSFNTTLGTTGVALQGEISMRQDAPLQVDDVELLFAALSPISQGLALTNQLVPGGANFDQEILAYRLHDVTQYQMTATKAFGPILGADQGVYVVEAALTQVADMPDKDVLRYEGPATYVSGNPIHSAPGGAHAGKPYERADRFADEISWGYRMAGRLDYNNALGAFNLAPRFSWQHDVGGISPGPGGNFIEGRKALTLGLAANYQNSWELDFSYTNYAGAGQYNLLRDRDFISFNTKYSF